jgi:endoglucanase
MGPGAGVKNADPSMKVVMGGIATTTTDYIRGMIDWCKEFRGYRADGSVDCPWDIINYHFYANDASTNPTKKQTTGVAPEIARADSFANEFLKMSQQYAGNMPVWVTETGYDLNNGSPQRAPVTGRKNAEETQADWILRTSLLYARSGIQRVFFYELYDDNPGNNTRYATCGLLNKDGTNRAAADFIFQTSKLFGAYTYKETINNDPIVDKYISGDGDMYMLVVPSQTGRTISYSLDIGKAVSAKICRPKAGSSNMDITLKKANSGKIEIVVSETPVFVTPLNT